MEDDRTTALESQLGQAKQIAEEADKKYEEVRRERISERQPCTSTTEVLALKHKSRTLRQWSNPVSTLYLSSPWAKQHRV